MTWENKLISIYFMVCDHKAIINAAAMRYSNNGLPAFTDVEVITIYLYVSTRSGSCQNKKQIYEYANDHLRSWFPLLPKYEAFVQRCNHLESAMKSLSNALYERILSEKKEFTADICEYIVDSLPIMLAKNQRSRVAKVAHEIANCGWCATKKMAYHGLKVHALGLMAAEAKLPTLAVCAVTPASQHDVSALKEELVMYCPNSKIYGDSAYCDTASAPELKALYNVTICPIQKRKKGQPVLHYDQKCQNTAISTIRQPIEGLFNWLIHHTGIQNAATLLHRTK